MRTRTMLYRIYRTAGAYPSGWNNMREFGPTSARFDPHLPLPHAQDRSVLYAAGSIPTAFAEAFGATRVVELSRGRPLLAAFALRRALHVLDLGSDWPTRAGGSQAISSGRKDLAREWAQAIFEEYDVDGIWYPSSMSGTSRRPADPRLHGHAVALFTQARRALPRHPTLNIPLDHPALAAALAAAAERYGYSLIP